MPWPLDDLDDTQLDDATRSPAEARPMLQRAIERIKDILAARGQAGGIAPLDASLQVPANNLPAAAVGLSGIIPLATDAQVESGLDVVAAVRPHQVAQSQSMLLIGGAAPVRGSRPKFEPTQIIGGPWVSHSDAIIQLVGNDYYTLLGNFYHGSADNVGVTAAVGGDLLAEANLLSGLLFVSFQAPADGQVYITFDASVPTGAGLQMTRFA